MGLPVVKLVADVPEKIKKKAQRIAQKKGISLKQLIIQLIENIHEGKKGNNKKK